MNRIYKSPAKIMIQDTFDRLVSEVKLNPEPYFLILQNAVKDFPEIKVLLKELDLPVWEPKMLGILEVELNMTGGTVIVIGGGHLIDQVKTLIHRNNKCRFITVPTKLTDAAVTDISTVTVSSSKSLPRLKHPVDLCYVNHKFLESHDSRNLIYALYDAYAHVLEYDQTNSVYTTNHCQNDPLELDILRSSLYKYLEDNISHRFPNRLPRVDHLEIIFRISPTYYQNGRIGLPHIFADAYVKVTGNTKVPHGALIAYGIYLWGFPHPCSELFKNVTILNMHKPRLSIRQIEELIKLMKENPCLSNLKEFNETLIRSMLTMEVHQYD